MGTTLTQVETPPTRTPSTRRATPLTLETAPAQVVTPLVSGSLPTARGLHWKDGFRGHMNTGEGVAQVRLDATGGVRIRMKLKRRPDPAEALVLNAALPANLRVAGPAHQCHLLADVSSAQAGFSRNVSEIRQGIRRNPNATGKGRRPAVGDRGPYEHVFEQLCEGSGSLDVVDREPDWEIGIRIQGGRVAVRVSPERSGLRLYRIVLKQAELSGVEAGSEGPSVEGLSVNDLALRLNEDMRFVRLSRIDAGVAVEARLSRALVDVERVVDTASAIAVVSAEVGIPLRTLLKTEGVARCYADTFDLPNGETKR